MKASSILLLSITTCFAFAAQSGEIGSGAAGLGNGVSVRIVTRAEPPIREAEPLKLSNRYVSGAGVLHRYLLDAANRTYFGYDLTAERLDGANQCRVSILLLTSVRADDSTQPVARASAGASSGGGSAASAGSSSGGGTAAQIDPSYRPILLPRYPAPQVVADGDAIALDLLTSPNGQQKLVDYIRVSCKAPQAVN